MKRRAALVIGCTLVAIAGTAAPLSAQGPCTYAWGGAVRVARDSLAGFEVSTADGSGCPAVITVNQPWVHLQFLQYHPSLPEYAIRISVDPNPGPDARTALVGTLANGVTVTQLGFSPHRNVAGDFDGDGSADPTVAVNAGTWSARTRMAAGSIYLANIITAQASSGESSKAVMGDFDGDSRTEAAMFNPSTGQWRWSPSAATAAQMPGAFMGLEVVVTWGGHPSDVPVPADYDGDGITDLAFYRPTDRFWYIRQSATRTARYVRWGGGIAGEVPVPADYDGDGRMDIAFFRPSDRYWYILRSSDGRASYINWGGTLADVPVPGDYDGDRVADVAFYRPSDRYWYIRLSGTGRATYAFWGAPDVLPAAADYDGDGKTDIAFFRPLDGYWYILNISTGVARYLGWVTNYPGITFAAVPVAR